MKEDDESTLSKDLLVSASICTRPGALLSALTPCLTKIFFPFSIFPNVFAFAPLFPNCLLVEQMCHYKSARKIIYEN